MISANAFERFDEIIANNEAKITRYIANQLEKLIDAEMLAAYEENPCASEDFTVDVPLSLDEPGLGTLIEGSAPVTMVKERYEANGWHVEFYHKRYGVDHITLEIEE
jgi:hypothetical protein